MQTTLVRIEILPCKSLQVCPKCGSDRFRLTKGHFLPTLPYEEFVYCATCMYVPEINFTAHPEVYKIETYLTI